MCIYTYTYHVYITALSGLRDLGYELAAEFSWLATSMAMTFSPQTRVFAPRDSLMFTSQDSWIDVHPEKNMRGFWKSGFPQIIHYKWWWIYPNIPCK